MQMPSFFPGAMQHGLAQHSGIGALIACPGRFGRSEIGDPFHVDCSAAELLAWRGAAPDGVVQGVVGAGASRIYTAIFETYTVGELLKALGVLHHSGRPRDPSSGRDTIEPLKARHI